VSNTFLRCATRPLPTAAGGIGIRRRSGQAPRAHEPLSLLDQCSPDVRVVACAQLGCARGAAAARKMCHHDFGSFNCPGRGGSRHGSPATNVREVFARRRCRPRPVPLPMGRRTGPGHPAARLRPSACRRTTARSSTGADGSARNEPWSAACLVVDSCPNPSFCAWLGLAPPNRNGVDGRGDHEPSRDGPSQTSGPPAVMARRVHRFGEAQIVATGLRCPAVAADRLRYVRKSGLPVPPLGEPAEGCSFCSRGWSSSEDVRPSSAGGGRLG